MSDHRHRGNRSRARSRRGRPVPASVPAGVDPNRVVVLLVMAAWDAGYLFAQRDTWCGEPVHARDAAAAFREVFETLRASGYESVPNATAQECPDMLGLALDHAADLDQMRAAVAQAIPLSEVLGENLLFRAVPR